MSRFTNAVAIATGILLVSTGAIAAGVDAPPPPFDAFSEPSVQTGDSWGAEVETSGASTEAGEPVTTADPTLTRQASVWLEWTAGASIPVVITVQSEAAKGASVGVFTGSELATATELAFAEGSVTIDAAEGDTYRVQVSIVAAPETAATGSIAVSLAPEPSKAPEVKEQQPEQTDGDDSPHLIAAQPYDSFATPKVVTGAGFSTTVDTTDATTEANELRKITSDSNYQVWNSTWLAWKAPASGTVTIDTIGTGGSLDTTLALFTGSKIKGAKRVGVNDDTSGLSRLSRIASVKVTKGTTYRIQVGISGTSSATASGVVFVNVRGSWPARPGNDDAASATTKTGTSWNVSASTIGSTIEQTWEPTDNADYPSWLARNSLWYRWVTPAGGNATYATVNSPVDAYVAVWNYTPAGGFTRVSFSDNAAPKSMGNFVAGQVLYFQLGQVATETVPIPGEVRMQFVANLVGPEISKVSPSSGKTTGSTKVTIDGKRFTGTSQVTFGGVTALSYQVISPTRIVAYSPPHAKGKVTVGVLATSYTASANSKSVFTYK
jgi:hypothetical protein